MSTHLYTYVNPTRERDLDEVARVLENDGVIALPMDLSWAFCCDASSSKALGRIQKVMPGPFTILLERHGSLPKQIKDKRRVVGIRIPESNLVLDLVKRFSKPLAATTIPPCRASGEEFHRLPGFGWQIEENWGHALDMVVDIGTEARREETTIIDLTSGQPVMARLGAGDPKMLGITI